MTKNILTGLMVVLVLGGLLTGGLWPWTTEGIVKEFRYNGYGEWSDIKFEDGRTIRLEGQPDRSILPGKYYVITYNTLKRIYKVEEKSGP